MPPGVGGSACSVAVRGATVQGSVRDLTGKPLGGATVFARNIDRNSDSRRRITTISDSNGTFSCAVRMPPEIRA